MSWKKIRIPLILLLVLLLIGLGYYYIVKPNSELTLLNKVESKDAIAAVLYSTTLVDEYDNDGKSILAFIDHEGDINSYETTGLESNALILHHDQLILHEKNQVTTLDMEQNFEQRDRQSCTVFSGYGQSVGVLQDNNISYSVFNQHFSEDTTYYISTIRWGNEEHFYCQDVHEYVLSDGHAKDKLYLLTTNVVQLKDLYLVEIQFEGENLVEVKTLLSEKNTEDTLVFSKLLLDQENRFGYIMFSDMYENRIELNLIEIDLQEKKIVDTYLLNEYKPEDDPVYFIYNKYAVKQIGDSIYYADGFGDVYTFDMLTKTNEYKFSLENYERKPYNSNEMIDFQDELLFFFRFDEEKGVHTLEEYQLNGERTRIIEIPQLIKLISQEPVNLYDFKMIQTIQ